MSVDGIDVSNYQGAIDWNAVAGSGIGFAIAMASEGNGFTDPWWPPNQAALLAPGPLVGGSYHFARPDLGNSPQAEADWYLSRHDPRCFDPSVPWIFSLDFEVQAGGNAWVQAWLQTVAARIGYNPWFYSNCGLIRQYGIQPANWPLWIAQYDAGPPNACGWPAVTAWQWGTRTIPGIAGNVDADSFLGDRQTLLVLAGSGRITPPQPPHTDPVPWRYRQMSDAVTTRPDGTEDRFTVQPDGSGRHIATTSTGTALDVLPGVWSQFYRAWWDSGITVLRARGLGLSDGKVYEISYSVAEAKWVGPQLVAG
jgi:GH25 family lysozyme M1 (1,4-beta-N-acetylmuramidase)